MKPIAQAAPAEHRFEKGRPVSKVTYQDGALSALENPDVEPLKPYIPNKSQLGVRAGVHDLGKPPCHGQESPAAGPVSASSLVCFFFVILTVWAGLGLSDG